MALLLLLGTAWAARPADATVAIAGGSHGVTCHAIPGGEAQCDLVLTSLDEAWEAEVEGLGFNAPLPDGERGGDAGLDIYLSHAGTGGGGGAYVTCDGENDNCTDVLKGDGRSSTAAYIVIDPELDNATLRRFCHHEFNHVLQYATDYEEPFLDLWEGTATAAETWTDPTAMLDVGPIEDYQATPWVSAVLQDGYWLQDEFQMSSWYEYGAVLWVMWLDQRWGNGSGSVGPALWAATANDPGKNEPDLLDAWDTISGDWRADLVQFCIDRGTFGTAYEPAWLTAIGGAPEVAFTVVEANTGAAVDTQKLSPLGMQYFDAAVNTVEPEFFVLSAEPGLRLVLVSTDGTVVASDEPSVIQFEGKGTVRFAVLNVPPVGFDADDALSPSTGSVYLGDARYPTVEEEATDCDGCGSFALMILVPVGGLALRRRRAT